MLDSNNIVTCDGRRTQLLVGRAAGVHEGLGHNREAAVNDVSFAEIKHEVGVLDQIHPEPETWPHQNGLTQ